MISALLFVKGCAFFLYMVKKFLAPILLLLLPFVVVAALSIGVVSVPFSEVCKVLMVQIGFGDLSMVSEQALLTIGQLRLPRILMSLLVGGALAMVGVIFQSIFRNPICDPYVLGISSGASVGAAIAFVLGWDIYWFGVTGAAFLAALLTLFFLFAMLGRKRNVETQTILLAGVAINFLLSAVITLLVVLNQQGMQKIIFWTMGSLADSSYIDVAVLFAILLIVSFFLFYFAKDLNILQLGGNVARTLGVNVQQVIYLLLIFSSLLIASAVALSGVIGFIGLIIPNICRLIWGNNVRKLLFFSMLLGAYFLLGADTLARTITPHADLPVGCITALAGAPYFLFLLVRNSKYKS